MKATYGRVEGEARRIVYRNMPGSGSHKLSELIWDISSIYMLGAVATADFDKSFRISAGYWTSINGGDGEMADYDWFSIENPKSWTHYSRSKARVTDATIADISISVPMLFYDNMCFNILAGYKDDFWKWSDSAKEFVYSSVNGFRDIKGNFGGPNLVVYEQSFTFPYLGIEASYVKDKLNLSFYATLSNMVEAEDIDRHLARDITYTGSFTRGSYTGIGATGSYSITSAWRIGAGLDYQSISEITGNLKLEKSGSEARVYKNTAGISQDSLMLSSVLAWTF